MALADVDGDGDLDLYVAHYIDWMHLADPTTRFEYARRGDEWAVTRVNGESTLKPKWKGRFTVSNTGRLRELPEADRLYLNNGNGTFHDVSGEPRFVIGGKAQSLASLREYPRDRTGMRICPQWSDGRMYIAARRIFPLVPR